ncbi:hypothetical protein ACHAWF_002135 [Thalassiosira exigua]
MSMSDGASGAGEAGGMAGSADIDGKNDGARDDAAVVLHGPSWFFLGGALAPEEQARLFGFVREHDATDWENLSPCMNPTPKTLELVRRNGTQTARTLTFGPNDQTGAVIVEMVEKLIGILHWPRKIKTLTVAVIRYCEQGSNPCVGSCLPPHIDHCNDGSWVFLFSLGCAATFQIESRGRAQRRTFEMKSGDALVFDPSSEAAVVHGITHVSSNGKEASLTGAGLGERFGNLSGNRFGVQCRVFLVD